MASTFTIKDANTQATVFSTSTLVDLFAPYNHWQATPNVTLAVGSYDFYSSQASNVVVQCGEWGQRISDGHEWHRSAHGAIPEPATWAMMVIGFGATESMIRRRKAVVA